MSAMDPRPRRGFTLIELMVASSLSLIVLAAALWSAAELQRRGTFEESLMEAQNTLRAMRDMLVVELQRSGMGVGSAELIFGITPSTARDVRFSINVGTRELFDGTNPNASFPKDTTFAGPPPAYSNSVSDALQIWSWDTEVVDKVGTPVGMLSLAECPTGQKSRRTGNDLCLLTPPPVGVLENRLIMVVKPGSGTSVSGTPQLGTSCIMRVAAVKTDPADPRLTIAPGLTDAQAMTSGPCMKDPTDLSFWADGSDIFVFLMRGVAFRVNWKTQVPTLERKDTSSDTTVASTWVPLSQDVETIRLSLGAVNTNYTGDPVQWFPDSTTTPAHLAIDDCDNFTCKAATFNAPGPPWSGTPATTESYEQLMSRVRMVRVQVITRTPRVDSSLIKKNGSTFFQDDDGYPLDGYKRRSSVLEIMPRNFSYSG